MHVVGITHRTSRAGDPHRHIHMQIGTRVFAAGKWRGLFTAALFRQQDAIRALGTAVVAAHPQLAQTLSEHGLTLGPATGEVTELVPFNAVMSKRGEQVRRNPARRWRLVDLAEHACFSKSQYVRVFHYAYGMSPFNYLKLLRVREMARLLHETDMPVLTVYQRVGWGARSHAAVAFRHYYGTTPSGYRRYGPATTSTGGEGLAVCAVHEANPSG